MAMSVARAAPVLERLLNACRTVKVAYYEDHGLQRIDTGDPTYRPIAPVGCTRLDPSRLLQAADSVGAIFADAAAQASLRPKASANSNTAFYVVKEAELPIAQAAARAWGGGVSCYAANNTAGLRGVNVIVLGLECCRSGYVSPIETAAANAGAVVKGAIYAVDWERGESALDVQTACKVPVKAILTSSEVASTEA